MAQDVLLPHQVLCHPCQFTATLIPERPWIESPFKTDSGITSVAWCNTLSFCKTREVGEKKKKSPLITKIKFAVKPQVMLQMITYISI